MKIPAKMMLILLIVMAIGTTWVLVKSYNTHFAPSPTNKG